MPSEILVQKKKNIYIYIFPTVKSALLLLFYGLFVFALIAD